MKVKICVGSSCYLKGAEKIIQHLQSVINELDINADIELAGAFCLGNCGDGIAISINDNIKHITTPEEAETLLKEIAKKD
ncbi:MAG: hypothetical protein A2287_10735 [Candidatus Melainabacteria bacterium RIFOXYA12_FULL_32_12]|nr:MAG: hypothetical protein A2104_05245 [Candidatus Melainabacteria bacterium GWF2_32_7]OGI18622.1 MAG: hypothetical protein A2255_01735 [Candidatus Melainabacteria bacterium RIFOXYA2_FULL_32_9]OGI24289.1 MAG: hypothetical protein A2287_10735 [Candidatus Melainabacteria bacterium RIFOXYA12_FULL_32_12]